jgi:hypothetical protein
MNGYPVCYGHRPDLADERKRNASRGGKAGGRGRPSSDLAALHNLLEDLIERVVGGLEPYPAAVAGQLVGVRLRLLEFERKVKETDELEAKLDEMAEALERQKERSGAYGSAG